MKTIQYIVITIADYTKSELTQLDSIADTITEYSRKNKDGTKYIAKITPDSTGAYDSLVAGLTMYSKSELEDQILSTSDWIYSATNGDASGHPGPEPLDT